MSNRRGKRTPARVVRPPVKVEAANTRKPITKQRSEWKPDLEASAQLGRAASLAAKGEIAGALEPDILAFTRNVGDGRLDAYVGTIPSEGIHLSIAHKRLRGGRWEPGRYPTWDEIADARDALLPADKTFVMYLPKEGDYLAVHPTTFHLHEELPPGTVKGHDGSVWTVHPITNEEGQAAADEDGYPLCRILPYAVPLRTGTPAGGGESDVNEAPAPDAAQPVE
jgi:hypothetical protein